MPATKKRNRKTALLCVGLVLAILVGLSFAIPIYGDICSKNEYTNHEDCPRYHIALVAFWHVAKTLNDYGVAIAAVATVFIAWFTWSLRESTDKLWEAGERQIKLVEDNAKSQSSQMFRSISAANDLASAANAQADATQKSLQIARKEFIAAHRPEMVVHSIRVLPFSNDMPPDQQAIRVEFGVINAGRSTAEVTGSAVYIECLYKADRPYLPKLRQNDWIATGTYEVGNSDTVLISGDQWSGLNFFGMKETGKVLYLSGWIAYQDGAEQTRTTFFCREYRLDSEQFHPVIHPEANCTY